MIGRDEFSQNAWSRHGALAAIGGGHSITVAIAVRPGDGACPIANFIWRPRVTIDQQASLDQLILEQRVVAEAAEFSDRGRQFRWMVGADFS